jgi:hypothetical protein
VSYNKRFISLVSRAAVVLIVWLVAPPLAAQTADPLAPARLHYNSGRFAEAIAAASSPLMPMASRNEAKVLIGRARLERYRTSGTETDLASAREAFREVDPSSLSPHARAELLVGLAEALFLDSEYRAAAELFRSTFDQAESFAPHARDELLDWWATSVDRFAQTLPPEERAAPYNQIISRMDTELRKRPGAAAAAYWLPAAALARGDLARAWDLAVAGYVRALLDPNGAKLRANLDQLVLQGIIPERVKVQSKDGDVDAARAELTGHWELVKKKWAK